MKTNGEYGVNPDIIATVDSLIRDVEFQNLKIPRTSIDTITGATPFALDKTNEVFGHLSSLFKHTVTPPIVVPESTKPAQGLSQKRTNDLLNGMLLLAILTAMTIALPFLRFFLLDAFVCNLWMQTLIHGYDQCKNTQFVKGSHWYGSLLDIFNQVLSGLTSNNRAIYRLLTKNFDECKKLA